MSRFGYRIVAACAVLVALALVQDPGLLVADTKFDLVTAPGDWLARSLHVWDAEGGFGQVQNQAYGYLWPMGSFFAAGALVHMPGWVVQRLWQGLVMWVALAGTARVARALGVRSDAACLVAGFAFALSPRLLTSLGPISIEVWPHALAPWVLLPLVHGATRGSPRRAAALSALAVAMVGGVNAAATAAVLPLGVVWVLTRTPGPRRRALMTWWPVFTLLGTLWWLVPLVVMGRYSPPFLDFTESAAATTFPTTIFDALRGTSHWVPYGDLSWRGGNEVLRSSRVALYAGVLLLLGLAGLADRRTPHRVFLGLSLLLGVLLVTFGHDTGVRGWLAAPSNALLDGVLAPLRNLHKFDVVIRLPLVLGLGFVVDRLLASLRDGPGDGSGAARATRFNQRVLVGAAVLALAGSAAPALGGRIEQSGATLGTPDYWQQAADYVADHTAGGTTLLVPGSRFGEYVWGDTGDEPMQWLARSRWAVRNVAILTEPGNIRMLDGIEERFTEGRGSRGLTAQLRRAGVEHLVVRNDLRFSDDRPDPVLVHQAIADSPGLTRSAAFGPLLGGDAHLDEDDARVVVNGGRQARYPAVEVYDVSFTSTPAVTASTPTTVVAGPEDLPDLLDSRLLGEAPVQLATDVPDAPGAVPSRVVLTDGLRARERSFARLHDGDSATLTPGDVRRTSNRLRDYLVPDAERWSTRAELRGARSLSASSSRSDAVQPGGSERGALPYAALDDAADTAWVSGFAPDQRAWWRVDLDEDVAATEVSVTASSDVATQQVRVVTNHGTSEGVQLTAGGTRRIPLPAGGPVSWVRVEDASVSGGRTVGLAEVDVVGVDVQRVLRLPSLPGDWGAPDVVALKADRDDRTGCVEVGADTRCSAGTARAAEDGPVVRRTFALSERADYAVAARARPRAGAALDRLVVGGQPVSAEVSSTAVPDPRAGAVAAIDGDPTTTWLAATDDEQPALRLSWLGRQTVSGLDLSVDPDVAAQLPDRVLMRFFRDGGTLDQEVDLGADGTASFAPVQADGVEIRVQSSQDVSSVGFDGVVQQAPVGIGEVDLVGLPYLPLDLPGQSVRQPCGTGPTVQVGPRTLQTALKASPAALLGRDRVPTVVCRALSGAAVVALDTGAVDVAAERSDVADAVSVTLTSAADPGPAAPPVAAGAEVGGDVARRVEPDVDGAVVALRQNANAGWRATQGGRTLRAVTLDGWQQGFRLVDDDPVQVSYEPDRAYRAGLVAGGVGVLALLGVVLLTGSRWRGADPPEADERRVPPALAVLVACAAGGLLAGTVGLLLAVVAEAVVWVLSRRAPEVVPWVLAVPVLVAAAAYAAQPWGSGSGWAGSSTWVGYQSVVPVVGVVLCLASRRREKTVRSRMPGTSTNR